MTFIKRRMKNDNSVHNRNADFIGGNHFRMRDAAEGSEQFIGMGNPDCGCIPACKQYEVKIRMIRKYAMNILKQYREKPTLINEIETVEEAVWLDEALDMAIQALEQEPCEDAISRQVALETLEKLPHEYKTAIQRKVTWGIEECEAIIASLPTIKQKVGKWIRVHYINDGKDTAMNKCSNCQEEFGWDIETGISFEDYKFCPNCGCFMKGDNDERS